PRRPVPRVSDLERRRCDHAADRRDGRRAQYPRSVSGELGESPGRAPPAGVRREARGDEAGDLAQNAPSSQREAREMSDASHRPARILVALFATADAGTRVELDVYRYLLGEAPPELVGLIVEDPTLFAHAASRLAREIVLSGVER